MAKEVTKRADNYSQWYDDLVVKADLAERSAVRGCMVIKPYGYAIWEKMHDTLDKMFKDTGHVNAYFPLFIPKSFLSLTGREWWWILPQGLRRSLWSDLLPRQSSGIHTRTGSHRGGISLSCATSGPMW